MKTRSITYEKGQSIILIALMFFAMVVMLALVLDGGNIYAQRRAAQLAADAGA
ncbi:MAG: pilus assembly protein TadG-related protein, partial [Anaerolineales bacterium]